MEIFMLLLLLAVFICILYLTMTLTSKLGNIESQLQALRKEILRSTNKEVPQEQNRPAPVQQKPVAETRTENWESGFKVVEDQKPQPHIPTPAEKHTIPGQPVIKKETVAERKTESVQPQPSFLERHPDLEGFIGENITSKIGIGILVLAIGFFVKYAIDNEWINEVGRVCIGLLCGGILVLLAHRLRNNYTAFSSVLLGGGLAIFYFTITLAYHEYHLFSQTVTFIIMVGITAFAVVLSQLYNRQELAVIALIGGFATPFMASSGSGNYKTLFIYLIILNTGLLAISYFKTWRILNILAFIFTVILFGSWLFTLPYQPPAETWKNAMVFASIFYFLFIVINIAHNIKENKRFLASDFGTILSNTCLYFFAVLYSIDKLNAEVYRGLFTATLALFNLLLSYLLYQKRRTDPNILYLLIGITISLVSLTAPIQLEGNYITLFWATEIVLLYWLFQKSSIKIIQLACLLVWFALLASIFMDWIAFYNSDDLYHRVILNKGFITMLFSALASFAIFYLRKKDEATPPANQIRSFPAANTFFLTGVVILFSAGFSEINQQLDYYYPAGDIDSLYLLAYTFGFTLGFEWIVRRYDFLRRNEKAGYILLSAALIVNLLTLEEIFSIEKNMLVTGKDQPQFIVHWIAAVLIGLIIFQLMKSWRKMQDHFVKSVLLWLLCTYIIVFLSTELLLAVNLMFYPTSGGFGEIERVYVKTVLPILWGVCSFTFMWVGMKYKFRTLRIISLTLFTVILGKLFLFDIRHIPVAGKIAAFFCLGVLLLIVSFMYQRLKKIIVQDGETSNAKSS